MSSSLLLLLMLGLGLAGWLTARARAWGFRRRGHTRLAALPSYHGWYAALSIVLPVIAFIALWSAIAPGLIDRAVLAHPAAANLPQFDFQRNALLAQAYSVARGATATVSLPEAATLVEPYREALARYNLIGILATIAIGLAGGAFAFLRLKPDFAARTRVERIVMLILLLASLVAILTTLGILVSLVFETVRFFGMVSPIDFLFGTHWSPDPMSDPAAVDGSRYGAVPLFWGTIFIGAIIAMIVAIPLGLMSAIYLTQYAHPSWRRTLKPALEILAGVPTVVYGYFAALSIAPLIRDAAQALGVANASSESALAAGLVMGVMIIPFVSSMADDSIAAVPQAMRDGSLAMGATKSETIRRVLLPAALPGIVAGVMLAVSRAIGETMIVVMAASTAANLTANPLEAMTTVTVQIVAMLTGEGSFDHPATLSAFALGFVLFMVTLALNFIALRVVKRFREAYD
ncbi:phosphate ABC transporter permease subunit PstC [Altererythrobacter sp. TH136]|uniref:phosphate ABC transporter permease subunit PstC n=1 Tax=Altererythrobacter sp. TH136 TaxID=2067415 RepID=UPI0011641ECB|nr:phosphate ABC transporter permease subunit PstC [Altererythrobacter sp. TH136]QDM39849.1 phosphate ABC transporter permease subunit PstC [Altererythrobacter sp. TH136]